MANSVQVPEPDRYWLITGVLRWSQGSAIARRGTEWFGDERLFVERPDLFGTKNEAHRPEVRTLDCWLCRQPFVPAIDSGRAARYCSKRCRSDKEVLLKRAARFVSRRAWPSIPNSASDIGQHIEDVRGYIGLCRMLIDHLGGRLEAGAPAPEVDSAEIKDRLGRPLKLSDKQALLNLAYRAYSAMYDLLNESTADAERAFYAERRQIESDRIWAQQQEGERRRFALADQWAEKLGDGDEQVAADLAALDGIR